MMDERITPNQFRAGVARTKNLLAGRSTGDAVAATFSELSDLDDVVERLGEDDARSLLKPAVMLIEEATPLFDDKRVASGLLEILMETKVRADRGGLVCLEKDSNGVESLRVLAARMGDVTIGPSQFSKTLVRHAIQVGRPVWGTDPMRDIGAAPGVDAGKSVLLSVSGPYIVLPLFPGRPDSGTAAFGALFLMREPSHPEFEEREVHFLRVLCRIIGPKLHTSQLYRRLQAERDTEQHEKEMLAKRLEDLQRRVEGEAATAKIAGRRSRKSLEALDAVGWAAREANWRPTLLVGPTGVGKKLFAHAIHGHSDNPRRHGTFRSVNCAALSAELLESELFGHEKGAFTGAAARKTGLFESARGGTIFLDEITETSEKFQASILTVVEDRVIRRVGGIEDVGVDTAIIAACNRDPKRHLRQDLYARLSIITIQIPALRERPEDIVEIAEFILEEEAKRRGRDDLARMAREGTAFTPDALGFLTAYSWPENVRELEKVLVRALRFTEPNKRISRRIIVRGVPELENEGSLVSNWKERKQTMSTTMLEDALRGNGCNVAKTAGELGLSKGYLYAYIKDKVLGLKAEDGQGKVKEYLARLKSSKLVR